MIIADDSALIRDGLASLLTDEGIEVVATLPDASDVVDAVEHHRPDVLIIDIRMPPTFQTEGLEAALLVRREHPETKILVLSQHIETRYAVELLEEGAAGVGYLLKDRVTQIDGFLDALRRVAGGGSAIDPEVVSRLVHRPRKDGALGRLTEREREVLSLMAQGHSNGGIAEQLTLNQRTAETHVSNILTKLDLPPETDRRVTAVILAPDRDLQHPGPGKKPGLPQCSSVVARLRVRPGRQFLISLEPEFPAPRRPKESPHVGPRVRTGTDPVDRAPIQL